MKIIPEKEKLKKWEIVIPVMLIILIGLLINGYFANGHLTKIALQILLLISIALFLIFSFPSYFWKTRLRINMLYNFIMWLIISMILAGVGFWIQADYPVSQKIFTYHFFKNIYHPSRPYSYSSHVI